MTHLFGSELSRHQLMRLAGNLDQIGGITAFQLLNGRAQGVRALQVRTGTGLAVTCLVDRALDISQAEYAGLPLCWRSQTGDAAPSYYDPEGDGWLRTFFGGLLTTCGLTNFGPPGEDRYGRYGLHGPINCLPAGDVHWSERWDDGGCTLEISGTIRQARVFGENLTLERKIWTRLGETGLHVEDIVTNHGFESTPHMILYHCNGGFPILAPGAQLYVSHSAVRPRDAEAEQGFDRWDQIDEPQSGFKEQVFIHTPVPCADGRAAVALVNPSLHEQGLGLAIRFLPDQLPALVQWRMLGEGTYVMGMEPANCATIEGRVEAGKQGTLPFLEPGESRTYSLEFVVLRGREEIDRMVRRIEEANAGHRAKNRQ